MLRAIALIIFWLAPIVSGAEDGGTEAIKVTADRLEADNRAGQVRFDGAVTAGYEDLLLRSEQMILFLDQADRSILRIEATGNVRMIQGARVASATRAIFFNRERKVVLSGDAQLKEGENVLEGQEITVLLDEERTFVGSQQGRRVKAVFHPPGARQ